MKISGSCAVVTGGADGIGKCLIEFLVAEGAKVVFGDISVDQGFALERELNKDGIKVAFCKCDVRIESDLVFLFQKAEHLFGGAQIVVNNAGIGPQENLDTTTSAVDAVMEVNLTAVIKGTSLAIQHFEKQKKNPSNKKNDFCVINVSSASALLPLTPSPVYSATKKGVLYFSQTMRYLKKSNIRVNCVLPSFAKTQLTRRVLEHPLLKQSVENIGGFITVSDVVQSMAMMITDESLAGDAYLVSFKKKALLPRISKSSL